MKGALRALGLAAAALALACEVEDPGFRILVPAGTRSSFKPDTFPSRSPAWGASPSVAAEAPRLASAAQGRELALSGPAYFVLSPEANLGTPPAEALVLTQRLRLAWRPLDGGEAALAEAEGGWPLGWGWAAEGQAPEGASGTDWAAAAEGFGPRLGRLQVAGLAAIPTEVGAWLPSGELLPLGLAPWLNLAGQPQRLALALLWVQEPQALRPLGAGRWALAKGAGPYRVAPATRLLAPAALSWGAKARPSGRVELAP